MPGIIRFGNQLASRIKQAQAGLIDIQPDGTFTAKHVYEWDYSTIFALFSNPSCIYFPKQVDPEGLNAIIFHTTLERRKPDIGTLTVESLGFLTTPPTTYELSSSRLDRPIIYHPDFNNPTKFPEDTKVFEQRLQPRPAHVFVQFEDSAGGSSAATDPRNKFRGIESFMVPTLQWKVVDYMRGDYVSPALDFTPTNLFKLDAPVVGPYTGKGIPDESNSDNHWIKVQHDVVNMLKGVSPLWQRTRAWLYNDLKWMTEIYS